MAILYCLECEQEVSKVYFDGYWIAERMLEGVPIGVKLAPSAAEKTIEELGPEDITIEWRDQDMDYLRQFNLDFYGQKARERAVNHLGCARCDECGNPDAGSLYNDEEHAQEFL